MKYKYVHIEDGPRCFIYASQYQQSPDITVFLCKRLDEKNYNYKMYRLLNKQLDGPVIINAATNLRLLGIPNEFSKVIAEIFEATLKANESIDKLSHVDMFKLNHTNTTIHVQDNKYSGQQLIAENNQKPDKVSPNVVTQNSYKDAITHLYTALRNRKEEGNFLATCGTNNEQKSQTSMKLGGKNEI